MTLKTDINDVITRTQLELENGLKTGVVGRSKMGEKWVSVCLPQDVGGSKMGVSYQSILGVSLSHTGHMDGEVLAAGASRP